MRKVLTFNVQNSDFESWFRQGKLTNSSWSDLSTHKEIGIFSLQGLCQRDTGLCQNFLINKRAHMPDCHEVFGWIYRGTYDACHWEADSMHDIVYCNNTTICQFEKQGEFCVGSFLTTTLSQS